MERIMNEENELDHAVEGDAIECPVDCGSSGEMKLDKN